MSERKRRPARRRPPDAPDPFGRALLRVAAPLLAGGAIALALSNATPVGAWVRGLFASRTRAMRGVVQRFGAGERPLAALRAAIVGSAKGAVHTVFGPPRTAMVRNTATPARSFWQADTWYYPLDRTTRQAMAIRFAGNVASEVDFVTAPELKID
jgi:hypothetical protein